jgi:uncharacterized repeat protein (TIGR03806 family)
MSPLRWLIGFLLLGIAASAGSEDRPARFDTQKRVLWTTSRVAGSPDPLAAFRAERVFPNLRFDRSLDLQCAPDGKRWFVVEHMGRIFTFPTDNNAVKQATLFMDLRRKDDRQLWSMTFHPKFAENGYLYVCYRDAKPEPPRCRISRFHVDPKKLHEKPTCDPNTEYIVCEWWAGEDHWGGCLRFGPDGYLYFSAGDGHGYADGNESGQDLSDFQASIHRIDVDLPDKGKAYGVPKDNPFVDTPGARPEIWAYGLRNVWKMSFDRRTGDLWAGDVGQDLWEMIYRIEKGGNYGWSVMEGTHIFRPERKRGPTPILPPVVEHEHSEFRSITGGFVYRGQRLKELHGHYVYGDYETGKVWAFEFDGKKATRQRELVDTPLKLVGFAEDHAGDLYLLDYQGTIHRLDREVPPDPAKPPAAFPRKLSETGLFRSTRDHAPEGGLIPYSVNSPLWSDHAHKERFIALPGDKKIEYRPQGAWGFPEGTVLVKTFSLDMEQGNPASRKRLETRLLHLEQDHWRGYTYLWNDEQTDAVLLEGRGALERKYTIRDPKAPGGKREQTWHFPSRAECTLCHTMPVGFVLGLSTAQMNKPHDYGGANDNQLRVLDRLGIFTKPLGNAKPETLPRMPDPGDESAPLADRARAYLHANCAHCHIKWGGGNALFELPYHYKLEETKTLNVKPQHGNLDIAGACVLVPGDPAKSLLLQRMKTTGPQRMPRVATSVVDDAGVKLIEAWIRQMKSN